MISSDVPTSSSRSTALAASRPVVLRGFSGAGKTTLAFEAGAWLELTGAYAERREIRCADNPQAALAELQAFADPASPTAGAPCLVIVDALDALRGAIDDAALGNVLTRVAADAALIATTRDLRDAPATFSAAWTMLTLGPLRMNDALLLARNTFAANGLDPGVLERDFLEERITAVGALPAGTIAQATRSDDDPNAPASLDAVFANWAPALESSLAALSVDDRALLTHLAPFVRGANVFIARTVAKVERERFEPFVKELRRAGLADVVELTHLAAGNMPCLRLHPALTPWLRSTGENPGDALRFARAYDDLGASLALDAPNDDPFMQARLYEFERPNFERAVQAYEAAGEPAAAAALRASLDGLAGRFGGHLDSFSIKAPAFDRPEAALLDARDALAAAEVAGSSDPLAVENERVIVGISLDRAGRTADAADETERACATLAPVANRDDAHANGYLAALRNLSGLQRKLGRNAEARTTLQTAVPLAERLDRTAAISVHLELGSLSSALGALDEAKDHYARALVRAQVLHAAAEEAGALFGLAGVAYRQSSLDEAERRTHDAAALCESIGDVRRVASAYAQLGSIAVDRGAAEEAERWFATLSSSPGYAACDAATQAFFDASIATDMMRLVHAQMSADPAIAAATTGDAWNEAVAAFLARDDAARRRVAAAKTVAERVVAAHGADPTSVGARFARDELRRIARMESAEARYSAQRGRQ